MDKYYRNINMLVKHLKIYIFSNPIAKKWNFKYIKNVKKKRRWEFFLVGPTILCSRSVNRVLIKYSNPIITEMG